MASSFVIPNKPTDPQQLRQVLVQIQTALQRKVPVTDSGYMIIEDAAYNNIRLAIKSPDGHYWRLQVDNTGLLFATDLGTTRP